MINFRLVRHLWLFLAVAEEQNFGRAAKRLGMSQPPLTEQIKTLESALRVKLFDRSRRGAHLTAAGAAILPAVRKFVEQMQQLELAVHEAAAGQTGVLTIGAINSAMVDLLPPMLERMRQRHPEVTVAVREIDSVEAVPMLRSGDIDLAFARLAAASEDGIETLPLVEDRLAVALPREHRFATKRSVRLALLAQESFVMFYRHVSPDYFDGLTAACRTAGFAPHILHEVRSVMSQVAFVGCGQGIALVPAAFRKLAPDNVVVRPLQENIKVVTTAMAWNKDRPNVLVDQLRADLVGRLRPAAG
ncbi:LysR family transcriptional regulator [Caenimonas terrae]|uniref:LysR family transcriptional regulator n=1 Tax=Caenimonas terrae TaxID=696074 RepID=A0ABW0N8B3_9BURK